MLSPRLASRYAKSILSLAKERGSLEETVKDMRLLEETLDGSKDLRLMLKSPIIPSDKKDSLEEGQHIILNQNVETPIPMLGHITSSYHSPTLGHSFGLAVIKDGHSLIGKKAYASTSDQKTIAVEIVKPVFYDENNEKLVS